MVIIVVQLAHQVLLLVQPFGVEIMSTPIEYSTWGISVACMELFLVLSMYLLLTWHFWVVYQAQRLWGQSKLQYWWTCVRAFGHYTTLLQLSHGCRCTSCWHKWISGMTFFDVPYNSNGESTFGDVSSGYILSGIESSMESVFRCHQEVFDCLLPLK